MKARKSGLRPSAVWAMVYAWLPRWRTRRDAVRVLVAVDDDGGPQPLLELVLRYEKPSDAANDAGGVTLVEKPGAIRTGKVFKEAAEHAWDWGIRQERFPRRGRVVWTLQAPPDCTLHEVDEGSAGAAFATALAFLFGLTGAARRRRQDPLAVISATTDQVGILGPVFGFDGKARSAAAVGAKLVVAPADRRSAEAAAARAPKPVEVAIAERVADAVRASTLRRRRVVPIATVLAALLAGTGTWVAERAHQEDEANQQVHLDQLVGQSRAGLGAAPDTAAAYAIRAAMASPGNPSALAALIAADYSDTRLSAVADVPTSVEAMDFSPDGTTLAAASAGNVEIYAATGRSVIARLRPVSGDVTSLRFTADGHGLVLGTDAGGIWAFTGHGGSWSSPRLVHSASGPVLAIAVSADTKAAWATAADGIEEQALDASAAPLRLRAADGNVTSLQFLPMGMLAVGRIASGDPSLLVIPPDGRGEPRVLLSSPAVTSRNPFAGNGVTSLALATRSGTLASGGNDGIVRLWNARTLASVGTREVTDPVYSLAVTADGATGIIATRQYPSFGQPDRASAGATVEAVDLATGDILGTAYFHSEGTITGTVAIDPATGALVTALTSDGALARLAFWTPPFPPSPHGRITALVPDPRNADSALALHSDGTVERINAASGSQTRLLSTDSTAGAYSMDIDSSGRFLAIGLTSGVINLYSYPNLQPVGSPLRDSNSTVIPLSFSTNGDYLAAADAQGKVSIWTIPARKLLRSLRQSDSAIVGTLTWQPSGNLLLVGDRAESSEVVDVATGRVIASKDFQTAGQGIGVGDLSTALSYQGGYVVGFGTGTLALYSDNLTLERQLPARHSSNVLGEALSPDGTTLVTVGADGNALVLSMPTGKLLASIASIDVPTGTGSGSSAGLFYAGAFQFATFTENADYAVLGDTDGRLQVIALTRASLVAQACRLLGPDGVPADLTKECTQA